MGEIIPASVDSGAKSHFFLPLLAPLSALFPFILPLFLMYLGRSLHSDQRELRRHVAKYQVHQILRVTMSNYPLSFHHCSRPSTDWTAAVSKVVYGRQQMSRRPSAHTHTASIHFREYFY